MTHEPGGRRRGRPRYIVYWVGLSAVVLAIDYALGPVIQFPAAFILPVSLAAWYNGRAWGLALAVLLPLVRLYFVAISDPPWTIAEAAANAAIRAGVLGLFAVLVDRVAVQREALSRRVEALEQFLPVCAVCKRIKREADATWYPVEHYLRLSSEESRRALVCPDCAREAGETFERR